MSAIVLAAVGAGVLALALPLSSALWLHRPRRRIPEGLARTVSALSQRGDDSRAQRLLAAVDADSSATPPLASLTRLRGRPDALDAAAAERLAELPALRRQAHRRRLLGLVAHLALALTLVPLALAAGPDQPAVAWCVVPTHLGGLLTHASALMRLESLDTYRTALLDLRDALRAVPPAAD